MLGILGLALSFSLLHRLYHAKSQIYRDELSREQQSIVLQHSVEAIFLALLYAPYTYVIVSINFEEQSTVALADKFVAMAIFMVSVITMYLIELALRFAKLRPLVLVHHLCAFFDAILTTFLLDTANIKAASLLNYFIAYEAFMFVGLVMYRLAPTHKLTRPAILFGMTIFALSRPVQCIWIVGALWASWENLILWEAILQIFLTLIFTALQLHSLTIHYRLSQKALARRREFLSSESECLAIDEERFLENKDVAPIDELAIAESERTQFHDDKNGLGRR